MSIKDGSGVGNLLISYFFKSSDPIKQVDEELTLKKDIATILQSKGYRYVIADDDLITEKLIKS